MARHPGVATVALIGDSHLARVRRHLHHFGPGAVNLAIGGSTDLDLPRQIYDSAPLRPSLAFLSVGTNDANPNRRVDPATFQSAFGAILDRLQSIAKTVYVTPPGVIAERLPVGAHWTNGLVDTYRGLAVDECARRLVDVLPAHSIISTAGPGAFSRDGLHLSGRGYSLLLRAAAAKIANEATTQAP